MSDRLRIMFVVLVLIPFALVCILKNGERRGARGERNLQTYIPAPRPQLPASSNLTLKKSSWWKQASEYIKENGLEDRIQYLVGDVSDEGMIQGLGTYELVYSSYSLHEWQ